MFILTFFPHWYVGVFIPFILAGTEIGIITVALPYGANIIYTCKKKMWCNKDYKEEETQEAEIKKQNSLPRPRFVQDSEDDIEIIKNN